MQPRAQRPQPVLIKLPLSCWERIAAFLPSSFETTGAYGPSLTASTIACFHCISRHFGPAALRAWHALNEHVVSMIEQYDVSELLSKHCPAAPHLHLLGAQLQLPLDGKGCKAGPEPLLATFGMLMHLKYSQLLPVQNDKLPPDLQCPSRSITLIKSTLDICGANRTGWSILLVSILLACEAPHADREETSCHLLGHMSHVLAHLVTILVNILVTKSRRIPHSPSSLITVLAIGPYQQMLRIHAKHEYLRVQQSCFPQHTLSQVTFGVCDQDTFILIMPHLTVHPSCMPGTILRGTIPVHR